MLKRLLFPLLLIFLLSTGATLPDLTPKRVQKKVDKILKAHVSYSKVTPELIQRILTNYLEELDPLKTYFTEEDIGKWTSPSDELLASVLEEYKAGNYQEFHQIHETLASTISRRNDFDLLLQKEPLLKDVDPDEFKDISWAKDSEELKTRLHKILSLQEESASKLDPETRDLYLQMRKKRRLLREGEILEKDEHEKEKWILSNLLKATFTAFDTHTNYFTPSEATQFMIQVQQRLFGIGAQLRDTLNGFTIMRILEGGPAELSGKLKMGDRIVAVNHEPIIGLDIFEAVEKIRGEKGTKILLTILRDPPKDEEGTTEKLEIEITRGEVVLEETRLEKSIEPFGDGSIAHLKLFSFYQDPNTSCSKDIKNALEEMKQKEHLKGVILDLRNNAGGLLDEAVKVAGLFMKNGIVVSVKDNLGSIHHSRTQSLQPVWNGPLIVLTNRASASAAEIVAGSLQDYGRALVVGDDHTFGKGSFQLFTLNSASDGKVNPEGEFKVTRGRYYTVSGKSPQLDGVTSDISVPGLLSELEVGERYAKYPLSTDTIAANFEDTLSDLPLIRRHQLGSIYKKNLQEKISKYQEKKTILQKNSAYRIGQNKNYQNFLSEIQKKHFDAEAVELFGSSDLQLLECFSIMKDLIFLLEQEERAAI